MTTDPTVADLLAFDRWATEQLLAAIAALPADQVDRPFDIGRGSLRKTLVHLMNATRQWQLSIDGQPDADLLDPAAPLPEVAAAVARNYDALAATCAAGPLDETLNLTRGTFTMSAPRHAVLLQVLTHGTHHRAQGLNMLRHLGVSPLPKSSVLDWMLATGLAKIGG